MSGYYHYKHFSDEKSEVHYSEFLLMFIKISNGEQLYFSL